MASALVVRTLVAAAAVASIVSPHAAATRGGRGGFGGNGFGAYGQGLPGNPHGAFGQDRLSAQALATARPTYLVIDIAEVSDADGLKSAVEKLAAALPGFSGRLVINSDHASAFDGSPPGRVIVIAFEDAAKLDSWSNSSERKEFDAARLRTAFSRSYSIEGMPVNSNAPAPGGRWQRMRFDPKPFEEIIKQRDHDLEKMKSICKGC